MGKKINPIIVRIFLLICILFGIILRFNVIDKSVVYVPIRADALDYFSYAYNLKYNGVYSKIPTFSERDDRLTINPDAKRPPIFPIFASIFMDKANLSTSLKSVLFAQAIVQCIAMLFLSAIIAYALGSVECCILILMLWTQPHLININIYFLTESLFSSLLIFSLCFMWLYQIKKNRFWFYLCAVSIGISAITRPTMEYFPLFFLIYGLVVSREQLKRLVIFMIICLFPIIVWKARNFISTGMISDPGLMVGALYHGSFPDFMYNGQVKSFGFPYRFDPLSEKATANLYSAVSVIGERVSGDPITYIYWYLWGKLTYLWKWNIIAGQGDIFIYPTIISPYYGSPDFVYSKLIHQMLHNAFVVMALIYSCFKSIQTFVEKTSVFDIKIFISLNLIYVSLLHMIAAPFPRYGIPFRPYVFLAALFFMLELKCFFKDHKREKR